MEFFNKQSSAKFVKSFRHISYGARSPVKNVQEVQNNLNDALRAIDIEFKALADFVNTITKQMIRIPLLPRNPGNDPPEDKGDRIRFIGVGGDVQGTIVGSVAPAGALRTEEGKLKLVLDSIPGIVQTSNGISVDIANNGGLKKSGADGRLKYGLNVTGTITTNVNATRNALFQCDPSSSGFTVTIPNPILSEDGTIIVIKNLTNSTNTITLSGTFDVGNTVIMNKAYESTMLVDSSMCQWHIVDNYRDDYYMPKDGSEDFSGNINFGDNLASNISKLGVGVTSMGNSFLGHFRESTSQGIIPWSSDDKFRLEHDGNVYFQLNGSSSGIMGIGFSGSQRNGGYIRYDDNVNNLELGSGGSLALTLDSSQSPIWTNIPVTSGGVSLYIQASGAMTRRTSSRKYKKDIQPLRFKSDKIYDLPPTQSFRFKTEQRSNNPFWFGFIAEDVYPVCPELVELDDEGKPDSVYLTQMIPLLVEEIKKLRNRIVILERGRRSQGRP